MRIIKGILILIFVCCNFVLKAQNYNINILPARLVYYKNIGLEPYFVYKYAEVEKRLSDKFSASVGVYYSKDKEEQALGSYKYYYYNIEPSLRYYFNKEHNMSGVYVGSGFSYLHSNLKETGRFADTNGDISKNLVSVNYIDFNLYTGYKFVVIKNRISIDFKLQESFGLFKSYNQNLSYSNQNTTTQKMSDWFQNVSYPILDLKIGYRFGFKK